LFFLWLSNIPYISIFVFFEYIRKSGIAGSASHVVLVVKNLPTNAEDVRDMGLIPELGRSPGGGHGNPFHGQKRLAGYSPGCKESATTEATWHSTW